MDTSPLNRFLDAWTQGIAQGDAEALAALFDEQLLFCATAPQVLLQREQVRQYYARAPQGLQVHAEPLALVEPAPGIVHAVVAVTFTVPGIAPLKGRLGLTLLQREPHWQVSQYHLAIQA